MMVPSVCVVVMLEKDIRYRSNDQHPIYEMAPQIILISKHPEKRSHLAAVQDAEGNERDELSGSNLWKRPKRLFLP